MIVGCTNRAIRAFVLILIFIPSFAFGQETLVSDGSIHDSANPSFRVGRISATPSVDGSIQGTVDVQNDNLASIGSIQLQLLLLEPAPVAQPNTIIEDNARMIDRILLPEVHSFAPSETKKISFSYMAPKLPEGDYRIRLQVVTSNGNEYGWDDYNLRLGEPNAPFLFLQPGPLMVNGVPHHPLDGVNVKPGTDITLPIQAELRGTTVVTATPVLKLYTWGITGKLIDTIRGTSLDAVPGKSWSNELVVKTASTPGAYHAVLELQDAMGSRISSQAEYRYVVEGVTGRIISAQLTTLTSKQAVVSFSIIGPADRASTVDAKVTVALLNNDAVVGEYAETFKGLGPEGLQSADATFDLSSVLERPGLRVVMTDSATGAELDRFETRVPSLQSTPSPNATSMDAVKPISRTALFLMIILLGIGAGMFALGWKRRNAGPTLLLALLVLPISVYGAGAILIDTNGDRRDPNLRLVINRPLHNNNVATDPLSQSNIPIEYTLSFLACNNRYSDATIDIYNLREGGKAALAGTVLQDIFTAPDGYKNSHLTITSPANIVWNSNASVHTNPNGSFDLLAYKDFGLQKCRGGSSAECTIAHNFVGSLVVPQSLDSTTLLWNFQHRHRKGSVGGARLVSMYTWLNFTPTRADLSVTKTGPASVEFGKQFVYNLKVSNAGPAVAKNVVVTDTVPTGGLTFNPSASSSVCRLSAAIISCTIPTLAASATSNLTLAFTTTLPPTCTPGSIKNTATVTSDNPDPITTNNSSSVTTALTCPIPVSVDLTAIPSTITLGSSATLSWASTNADTCSASGDWNGGKVSNGSEQTTPTQIKTYTYTITCTNTASGNTATDTATIQVNAVSTPTVDLKINASDGPIDVVNGSDATLTWSSTHTGSCVAFNAWTGTRATEGLQATGPITTSRTYELQCTGPGGSATDSVMVNVLGAPTVDLTGPSIVPSGTGPKLSWFSIDATSCTASGGWTGSKGLQATEEEQSAITSPTTYTIQCRGPGGSATDSLTVNVSSGNSGSGSGSGGFQETR